MPKNIRKTALLLGGAVLALMLIGCGSGSGSSNNDTPAPTFKVTVSGS